MGRRRRSHRRRLWRFPPQAYVPREEMDALVWLFKHARGKEWSSNDNWLVTRDPSTWEKVYVTGGHVYAVNLTGQNLSGNLDRFPIAALSAFQYTFLGSSVYLYGDISGWIIPQTVVQILLSGDRIYGAPDLSHNTALTTYNVSNCQMSAAQVDAILKSVYDNRMAFAGSNLQLNISGNSVPGGTYQAACPPTTGQEYAYELQNDSCGDGFTTWTITMDS